MAISLYQSGPRVTNWRAAKDAGDAGEQLFIATMRRRGWAVLVQPPGEAAAFDVELSARVEVKTDRLALTTGRVAVELSPGGLAKSRADFWGFIVGPECYLITTDALRRLVEVAEVREGCGDGKRTTCALVPMETLAQHARRMPLGGGGAL